MAFRYVVRKRTFGFDKTNTEKYVARAFSVADIDYDTLCDQITKQGLIPRGIVKSVMDGLIDAICTYMSVGATVRMGDFGSFRPGLNSKAQIAEEDVTANVIYRQKMIFTPGKLLKNMLADTGIRAITTIPEDTTDGTNGGSSGNTGGSGSGDPDDNTGTGGTGGNTGGGGDGTGSGGDDSMD